MFFNIQHSYHNSMRWTLFIFCLLWVILGAGCQQFGELNPSTTAEEDAKHQLEEASKYQLEGALGLVKNQQYEQALILFEKIAQTYDSGIINQHARYGIACSRMATAETADEMEMALDEWSAWFRKMPEKYHNQDPRLLAPVLHNYRFYLYNEAKRNKKWQLEKRWFHTELKKRRAQEAVLQRQIEELKMKIEAIETIDQNIQKKKRKITPSATKGTIDN